MRSDALERLVRRGTARRAEAAPRCDLCSEPVPAEHRHLLDAERTELLCACRPCSLLFDREAASEGHYRLVPERLLRLAPVSTDALGVPVGLAFFVDRGNGTVVAHYPSPAGPTQWQVDPTAWRALVDQHADLCDLANEVEALLVNTARGQHEHWIVPIEDCFRLVAVIRQEWKGLSGGDTVWAAVERFFAELDEQR